MIVIPAASLLPHLAGGMFFFDGSAPATSVLSLHAALPILTPSPSYSGGCSAAPIHVAQTTPTACTASYSFAGDGDHTGSNDSATILINQAQSCPSDEAGVVSYSGAAPPGRACGAGGGGGGAQLPHV